MNLSLVPAVASAVSVPAEHVEARDRLISQAKLLVSVQNPTAQAKAVELCRKLRESQTATEAAGKKVKVIFENCYLEDVHKIQLCEICSDLSADWVKTSTGYGTGGATVNDLRLMRYHAAPNVPVTGAGWVRGMERIRK